MILKNVSHEGCINFDAWNLMQHSCHGDPMYQEVTLHDGAKEEDNSEDEGVRGADTMEEQVVVETEDTVLTTEEQVFVEDESGSGDVLVEEWSTDEHETDTDSIVNSIPLMEVTYK